MGRTSISGTNLLAKLESFAGNDSQFSINYTEIAKSIGLNFWSTTLQKKFNTLINSGRIEVSKSRGEGRRFTVTILNPLTEQEKNNEDDINLLTAITELENKETYLQTQVSEISTEKVQAIETIEDNQNIILDVSEINDLFNEIEQRLNILKTKAIDLEDNNKLLQNKLEASYEREKVWRNRTVQLQNSTYRR